jgi:hypothetical protein
LWEHNDGGKAVDMSPNRAREPDIGLQKTVSAILSATM